MDTKFNIIAERRLNLMRVTMAGFFTPEEAARFAESYRAALKDIKTPGHLTLVDITGMKIQAQDVVGNFASLLASPDVRSRKLAFVCSSTLAMLQAQRLTDRAGVQFFDHAEDAEAWLLAG